MNIKREFLYEAIEDSRSTIRAMDVKSHVLSAIILTLLLVLSRISDKSTPLFILTTGMGVLSLGAFLYSVILPRFNPLENIKGYESIGNDYLNLFFPISQKDFSKYFNSLEKVNERELLQVIALEKLKLQSIVDAKIHFFKIALYWFFGSFLLFAFLTIAFN